MDVLKKRIGIIGGGQLGKMMILDAKRLGFHVVVLDPTPACPAHSIADKQIVASFTDGDAMLELAEKTDVVTYEFEHISVQALKELESRGYTVYPAVESLEVIQDKFRQKTVLAQAGIPVPAFMQIAKRTDILDASSLYGYPMMLKTCLGGYDGKGNALIRTEDDMMDAFDALGAGSTPLMVEAFVPFVKEISVLACRGIDGEIVVYPVGENVHVDSILDTTRVPADISDGCTEKATKLAHDVMEVFHGVGMFCVEMFVDDQNNVLVNEVAPRPHNSGHYTIEACLTSQFEQHIRAITGLPLGDVSLRTPVVMRNLLGEPGASGRTRVLGLEDAYRNPRVKVHLYGKEDVKPYRKMGHLTVVGKTLEEAEKEAETAKACIKIVGEA
ncbi:5-(carboxyamino)imidazole ribonucleotide synthase [Anaerotalea alkaliphila]|nr:5-(carboxyamino)imidazole ribonucleotide synthase [Anaerotalea alkaliphila]